MKLNYRQTFLVGLAFMAISTFWQLYDNIIPLMLKNTFGLGDTLAGGIMALDNILALFMLPFFGALSDRIDTPLGKRMPFILVGTALTVVAMLFLPLSDNIGSLPLFMTALFFTLLAISTYRSPAVALMPDITPAALRSKANAVINLMGALGVVIALVFIRILVPEGVKPNYFPIFALVAGVMVVATLVLFATVKEKKLTAELQKLESESNSTIDSQEQTVTAMPKAVRRSLILLLMSVFFWYMAYNGVMTSFSKYAQDVLGLAGGEFANVLLVATVTAVLSFIPVGLFACNWGRKRTILLGIVVMFTAFSAAYFFTSYHPLMNILLGLVGFGWAAINVNSYPMVVEMAHGASIGKFTGYYYTFSMAGQIVTPVLSGAFLEHVGYWTLFPYAAVFMALAFCTMLLVKHGDHKPRLPQDKLEMLDVGD